MRNKVFNYLVILSGLLCVVLSSCSKDEPTPKAEPKCTVLVYMVADNGLGSSGVAVDAMNLRQMQTVAESGALNGGRLLVFYDPYENGVNPELLEITAEGTVTLKSYTEDVSSLDAEFMRGVLNDAKELAPAPKNWLVLWSHGTGWKETADSRSSEPQISVNSFGQDSHPERTEMNVTTLASVLGDDKYYDVLYFDCCFMGCIEVVYELRNSAKEIVASAAELPIEGMPYSTNIPAMFADDATARQVAQNTLDYYKSDAASNNSCTIAVVETDKLDQLAEASRAIQRTGAVVPSTYYVDAIKLFRKNFTNSYTYDFGHYYNNIPVEDQSLIDDWNEKYRAAVTYFGSTPISYGLDMTGFTGLGSYIVRTDSDLYIAGYMNLSWYKDVISENPEIKIQK